MSIDNQLLIGTLVFAGLGFYILSYAQPSKKEVARTEKEKNASEIRAEFDRLRSRMGQFEENDRKKGRNREIAPLSQEDRAGLVEVITLLRQVEKKQQKTRALDMGEAERFHRDVGVLDKKARDYLERYKHNQDSDMKDARTVTQTAEQLSAERQAAMERGARSHSRTTSASAAPFVADSRDASAKKRKPNFVQNKKPASVFEQQRPSNNRTQSADDRSAFETNEARDDTLDHATGNAETEEATSSGAHGKNGQHIRPLDSGETDPAEGNDVEFNQAPGPEPDNVDTVERSVSTEVAGEGVKRSSDELEQSKTGAKVTVVDLTQQVPEKALELMEQDLIDTMGSLKRGEIRLDTALDERLRTVISTLYDDDAEEGNRCIQLLRAYKMRDKDLTSRKHKRPLRSAAPERGTEKFRIREVSEGSRVILARGAGALGQRAGRFGPTTVPRSTAGRSSVSRERVFEQQMQEQRSGSLSRSVSPARGQ